MASCSLRGAAPRAPHVVAPARISPVLRPLRPVVLPAPQVCQARIANVEIPNKKCIRYSLQYVFGVGDTTACKVLTVANIDYAKRTYQLTEEEVSLIRDELETNYTIEGDLRRKINLDIKRLKEIQCYRGRRHIANLPVRGQGTKNNARTRKGKKQMAIAGKK